MKWTQPILRASSPAIVSAAVLSLMGSGVQGQEAVKPSPTPAATPAATPEALPPNVKVAGQDVPVPARRKYVAPEYPADAASQGIRGIVIVEAQIGEDGKVESVRVARSIPGLDEAAMSAVRLWEYEPSKVAGKPVKVRLTQPITFALRLPDLQRASGVPELKSGGAPPIPTSLATAEDASVAVILGAQGEVSEAAVIDGNPVVSEALLRAVKTWRFVLTEGAAPPSFTVTAHWAPGPPPSLTLRAFDLKTAKVTASTAPVAARPSTPGAPAAVSASGSTSSTPAPTPTVDMIPAAQPKAVDTEVLPARPEPPAKEEGMSAVADVLLGGNIPDLARGRRPVWPPLARLGNITGDVVVRFSVDLAGKVTVHSAEGPEMLKASAEQAVGTWLFRRTAIDRLHLIATFKFAADRSVARVERQP